MEDRGGAWLKTFTGRRFYPLDPRVAEVDVLDIAHALSLQCRFAGHTKKFYSVAEHSVRVSYEVPDSLALEALFHDASEAYLVDIPRPIKPYLAGYGAAEQRLMTVIAAAVGFTWPMHPRVRWADDKLLAIEAHSLMAGPFDEWHLSYTRDIPEGDLITDPHGPVTSQEMFMMRFREIMGTEHIPVGYPHNLSCDFGAAARAAL